MLLLLTVATKIEIEGTIMRVYIPKCVIHLRGYRFDLCVATIQRYTTLCMIGYIFYMVPLSLFSKG